MEIIRLFSQGFKGSDAKVDVVFGEAQTGGKIKSAARHVSGHGPRTGKIGQSWELIVRPVQTEKDGHAIRPQVLDVPIGFVTVSQQDNEKVLLSVPAKTAWSTEHAATVDPDGRLFASLLFQLLNALNKQGLISLPGDLPVR